MFFFLILIASHFFSLQVSDPLRYSNPKYGCFSTSTLKWCTFKVCKQLKSEDFIKLFHHIYMLNKYSTLYCVILYRISMTIESESQHHNNVNESFNYTHLVKHLSFCSIYRKCNFDRHKCVFKWSCVLSTTCYLIIIVFIVP